MFCQVNVVKRLTLGEDTRSEVELLTEYLKTLDRDGLRAWVEREKENTRSIIGAGGVDNIV